MIGRYSGSPEMEKLKRLLDEEKIPYAVRRNILGGEGLRYSGKGNGYHSADIISDGYGREYGLLEIMGLGYDCVPLNADEIFEAIKNDYYKRGE